MFCSVNVRACLEMSDPAPGTAEIDLLAASKNIPNAFSACSMVFSANSRNSAGTSSFGSAMFPPSLRYSNSQLPYKQDDFLGTRRARRQDSGRGGPDGES